MRADCDIGALQLTQESLVDNLIVHILEEMLLLIRHCFLHK